MRWWPRIDSMADAGGLLLLETLSIGLFAAAAGPPAGTEVHARAQQRLSYEATSRGLAVH